MAKNCLITTEEAKTHCCENYSDIPVVYELPAQTEISSPQKIAAGNSAAQTALSRG